MSRIELLNPNKKGREAEALGTRLRQLLAQTETIATSAAESSAPHNGTTGVVGSTTGAPRGPERPPNRSVLPSPESGSAILNHPTTSTRDQIGFSTSGKKRSISPMSNQPIANERLLHEAEVAQKFLEAPNEDSFAELFNIFTPQLVAFFRARNCEFALAEDLAQDVMLIVYRKGEQIRDGTLFRAWLFKIARNALCRHYGKRTREVETVDLADVTDRSVAASHKPVATAAFEFLHWMAFLDSREREVITLRFIEQWEYHEIGSTQAIPIGTVQWKVFNAKKKLAPHLTTRQEITCKAA